MWNKGSVPRCHIFWILFWISFVLNFYCSGQTLVNYGQRWLAHISRATYWAFTLDHELIWCDNMVYFVGINCFQWFAMYFWYLLCKKKCPIHYKLQNHRFFLNNFCNTQCEDPLSCHGAPTCQILGHLDNVCLGFGHDPSHLPNLQWTFYPVVPICEEMCKSVAVTQVSSYKWVLCVKQRKCAKVSYFLDFVLNFYCSGQTLVNNDQRRLAHISMARY